MTSLAGPRMRVQDRARRFYHSAHAASIRHATGLGFGCAFALLCMEFASANTMTEANVNPLVPYAAEDYAGGGWYGLLAALLVLTLLMVVALCGWWRARTLLRRSVESASVSGSEWQRRYAVAEARERAAKAMNAAQAATAVVQERERIYAATHHYLTGPMSALAGLVMEINGDSLPAAHRSLAGRIEYALRTCARVLEDSLAPTPVESRVIALEENPTDLREVINGVTALFAPSAAREGVQLAVSVDRSVAPRILADDERIGQILFYLLSRAIRASEHAEIAIIAWAAPLNAGSQRVFISVEERGADLSFSTCPVQSPLPWPMVDRLHDESVAGLAICKRLAHHMRGELTVSGESGFGTGSTFSASFAVEPAGRPEASTRADFLPLLHGVEAHQANSLAVTANDLPDPAYLEALSSEGIDLTTFLCGWHQSIRDDLLQMRRLRASNDVSGLRALLHRLSGAIGLVGARNLMEALRRASVVQPEPETQTVDALIKRIEALMMELDKTIDPYRSSVP